MERLTRVLVVDDQPVVAQGTASVLVEHGFDVVGIATTLEGAIDGAIASLPDVVLCDVMLSGEPLGLELPGRLAGSAASESAIVYLSSYDAPWFQSRAVKEGGMGYLSKSSPIDELVAALRTVAGGGVAFRAAALKAASRYQPPSPRERQIIALAATGATNGEIGSRLGIKDHTVEDHLARLYAKYGVASRAQLVTYAFREGWLPDDTGASATRSGYG
jgi:DNA-binding NarL/FixJ family response regulator